ncbi:MAG: DUF3667 domain-containing protein [Ferruginibacter sp.]|nr:DUF3667 domain-containing protein [Chitinophagaceae bacterium]
MSHIPERKEKDCLNCGTIVQGHYCQNCGQENVVPKETFWHMVTHFFYDITHFDSNFFHTIHRLILKPGFLSREYMAGRRASYLHPVKMYVFTSAIFFLLFFSFFKAEKVIDINPKNPVSSGERDAYIKKLQEKLKKDTGNVVLKSKLTDAKDTSKLLTQVDTYDEDEGFLHFGGKNYKTRAAYDSAELTLPPAHRDGWLMRRVTKKQIDINNKYRHNPSDAATHLVDGLFHRLPYLLFVSLPLFALILRLVYIRRKQFYFADHGVFTIHLYIFSFIVLLIVFGLDGLLGLTGWKFIDTIIAILFIALWIYLYLAMRNFYKQGWGKTFLKFLLVTVISLVMMLIVFLFFLVFSAATI